jgi:hypothetical protein
MTESPKSTEVLDGLIEVMTGEKIGRAFVLDFIHSQTAKRLLNEGAPYAGKTTALEQEVILAQQINTDEHLGLEIETESYEEMLKRTIYPDSVVMNTQIIERYLRHHGKTFGELPACGDMLPKDRGVTAGRKLGIRDDTWGWYLIPSALSKMRATAVRTTIPDDPDKDNIPDEEVKDVLAEQFGINVIDTTSSKSLKQVGKQVKNMLTNMATVSHVQVINQEIKKLWSTLPQEQYRKVMNLSQIITANLPESYKPEAQWEEISNYYHRLRAPMDDSNANWEDFVRNHTYYSVMEAALMEYTFREWGFSEDRFKVMFNPPQEKITWYLRD